MRNSNNPPAPPNEPTWDITFTRLAQALLPRIEACTLDLARRFHAVGLTSDAQVRQTPRGLSTFLALVGQRGLVCILDLTVVDGMATGQGPHVMLEMRLLDACGDVVAEGPSSGALAHTFPAPPMGTARISKFLGSAATALYVSTLAQFDLLRPPPRPA